MENPFQVITQRLENIERILNCLQSEKEPTREHLKTRQILTLVEFCHHARISKQTAYKLTSTQSVPHSKRGKKLYFDREEIDAWLLENRVPTATEIQKKARDYMTANPIRKRA